MPMVPCPPASVPPAGVVTMGIDSRAHWEEIYTSVPETNVSWYQDEPRLSLELIGAVAPTTGGRIVDVGGGASVLVDKLLDAPWDAVAVLDISASALAKSKERLGMKAGRVQWIAADVTQV